MANIIKRRIWNLPDSQLTDPGLFLDRSTRREFLKDLGLPIAGGIAAAWLSGCRPGDPETVLSLGKIRFGSEHYPAGRNSDFEYGRAETSRVEAAKYTNFYEFTGTKRVYEHIESFQPIPWTVRVDGLCKNPREFDLGDIYETFSLEERAYRHRCVETWAMCVPWTGFPLAELLRLVEPLPQAKFVRFETFHRPQQAPQQDFTGYPWPYTEGLTMPEAENPLAFLATGVYGEPLLKQHGAPIRLVVPWKYGFKSIKSITRIELTASQPATFWNTLNPHEYGFTANVDPDVPHPRWSQQTEWMLGTQERFQTVKYNGYGEFVASLYPAS